MVSSGANVIIWCYHVMLSSGMITHPFFIFPENFTYSDYPGWPVAAPGVTQAKQVRSSCEVTIATIVIVLVVIVIVQQ